MFLCIFLCVSSAYHFSFVSLTNIHQPSQHQKDLVDGAWGRKMEELHWEVCLPTEIQRCLTEEESLLENRNRYKEHPFLEPWVA